MGDCRGDHGEGRAERTAYGCDIGESEVREAKFLNSDPGRRGYAEFLPVRLVGLEPGLLVHDRDAMRLIRYGALNIDTLHRSDCSASGDGATRSIPLTAGRARAAIGFDG